MYAIRNNDRYLASAEYRQLGIIYTKDLNRIRIFTSAEAAKRNVRLKNEKVVHISKILEHNVDDSF